MTSPARSRQPLTRCSYECNCLIAADAQGTTLEIGANRNKIRNKIVASGNNMLCTQMKLNHHPNRTFERLRAESTELMRRGVPCRKRVAAPRCKLLNRSYVPSKTLCDRAAAACSAAAASAAVVAALGRGLWLHDGDMVGDDCRAADSGVCGAKELSKECGMSMVRLESCASLLCSSVADGDAAGRGEELDSCSAAGCCSMGLAACSVCSCPSSRSRNAARCAVASSCARCLASSGSSPGPRGAASAEC